MIGDLSTPPNDKISNHLVTSPIYAEFEFYLKNYIKFAISKFVKLEISIRRGRKLRKFLGDSQDGGQSFDRALTIRLRTEITAGMATFGGSKNTMADSVESHSRLEWPRG